MSREVANLKSYVDREVAALRRDIAQALRMIAELAQAPILPVRQWTGIAAAITITKDEVNVRHIVKNTAAHNFNLPVVDVRAVVVVVNDSGSTNNISVRDSAANLVSTVTPGGSTGLLSIDTTGAVLPY